MNVNPGQSFIRSDGVVFECLFNTYRGETIVATVKDNFNVTEYINYRDIKEIIPESRVNTKWSTGTPYQNE